MITLEIPEPTWRTMPHALKNRLAVHVRRGRWQRSRVTGECVFVLECHPSIAGVLGELEREMSRGEDR